MNDELFGLYGKFPQLNLVVTYFIGPPSVAWCELRPTPPLPPMRVLEVQWSHAVDS